MTWAFVYTDVMVEHDLNDYDAQPALLRGYHRSFNHASTQLWGSEDHPCPVLGLDPGGECWGVAVHIPWTRRRAVLRRLAPPEAVDEFRRVREKIELRDGAKKKAVVWVSKPKYGGAARWGDADDLDAALRAAHGTTGRGIEYVRQLVHALELWELEDPLIASMWERYESWRPR